MRQFRPKKKAGLVGPTHSFFTIGELGGSGVPKSFFLLLTRVSP
jgi:hypothetical protein